MTVRHAFALWSKSIANSFQHTLFFLLRSAALSLRKAASPRLGTSPQGLWGGEANLRILGLSFVTPLFRCSSATSRHQNSKHKFGPRYPPRKSKELINAMTGIVTDEHRKFFQHTFCFSTSDCGTFFEKSGFAATTIRNENNSIRKET